MDRSMGWVGIRALLLAAVVLLQACGGGGEGDGSAGAAREAPSESVPAAPIPVEPPR